MSLRSSVRAKMSFHMLKKFKVFTLSSEQITESRYEIVVIQTSNRKK